MNVLLLGYLYGHGGIQTHTHFLATGLVERGHEVTVVTPAPLPGREASLPRAATYRLVPYSGAEDALHGFRLPPVRFDVGVVVGTGWNAMIGTLVNRRIRKRVFFEVMSGVPMGLADPRRLIHAGFDALVGQASPVEQAFRRGFGWTGLSTTIPALPEPLELLGPIPAPVGRAPGSTARLRAAYFGRLAPHKGVDFLIRNWDRIADDFSGLDVFGTGPEIENLQRMIDLKGCGDEVRLRGRYPTGSDYVSLLQQYDMVMLPTVGAEGAPLVLLEAMACGVPFVANGVGGIPDYANPDCEITGGDICEFLPLVQKLAHRIRSNDVRRDRLMAHYDVNYSYKALVTRWETYLDSLSSGRGPEQAQ
jgi:glycosyltransferase involved in cell wall biosynthesis